VVAAVDDDQVLGAARDVELATVVGAEVPVRTQVASSAAPSAWEGLVRDFRTLRKVDTVSSGLFQ